MANRASTASRSHRPLKPDQARKREPSPQSIAFERDVREARAAGILSREETGKVAGASAGAVAGAVMGAFAGPIGLVAGGVLGAVAGAAAGVVYADAEAERARIDEKLDEDIGVIGGRIGAASPDLPPSSRGVFSGSSAGVGGTGGGDTNLGITPDAGPIPKGE